MAFDLNENSNEAIKFVIKSSFLIERKEVDFDFNEEEATSNLFLKSLMALSLKNNR